MSRLWVEQDGWQIWFLGLQVPTRLWSGKKYRIRNCFLWLTFSTQTGWKWLSVHVGWYTFTCHDGLLTDSRCQQVWKKFFLQIHTHIWFAICRSVKKSMLHNFIETWQRRSYHKSKYGQSINLIKASFHRSRCLPSFYLSYSIIPADFPLFYTFGQPSEISNFKLMNVIERQKKHGTPTEVYNDNR